MTNEYLSASPATKSKLFGGIFDLREK